MMKWKKKSTFLQEEEGSTKKHQKHHLLVVEPIHLKKYDVYSQIGSFPQVKMSEN